MTSTFSRIALEALPSKFEGRVALLVEKMLVYRVKIFDVCVHDDGFFTKCQLIETRGLHSDGSWSMNLSSHGSYLFATNTCLSAGWVLFFDPDVIQRVLDIVAMLPAGKNYRDDYTSRPAPKGSRFITINSPGSCVTELYRYLRVQQITEYSKRNELDV